MSLQRWDARRDVAEKPIRDALQAVGAEVWQVSGRPGLPDLLVRFRRVLYAAEVKSDGGRETKHQGAFPIWRTPNDALRAIGAIR
jgi:hypothetical protein